MRSPISFSIICLFLAALAAPAHAAVPEQVTFTARFVDQGVPAQGPLAITLQLYRDGSGGTAIWSETHAATAVDGLVSVAMGKQEPLDASVLDGPLFLEVTVSSTVLSPRLELGSVPFALQARRADQLGDLAVGDVQRRVSQACPANSSIRSVNADGSVVCESDTDTDTNTTYSASCGANQFVKTLSSSGATTCGALSFVPFVLPSPNGTTQTIGLGVRTLCVLNGQLATNSTTARCLLNGTAGGTWSFTAQSGGPGSLVECRAICL